MQRAQRAPHSPRAKRLNRVLAGATAVPVLFLAAACSSDSGSDADAKASASASASSSASASASASPTIPAAKYAKLPEACKAVSGKTLDDLVPGGAKSAKGGSSGDVSTRASCSWNGLDNNGVKGSQYRWLNVSLLRFASDPARGAGDEQARTYFRQQVQDAQAETGAKNTKAQPVSRTGDEATLVRYETKKKEGVFKQQTVVARVANVVVTVDYNGAGLAGDKSPDADDLAASAEKVARETVAAVAKANGEGGSATDPASPSASKSSGSSASPSASAGKAGASKSASPSASASATAADS
ncbi:DUF3558 domain-containing protein [Streptomyces sp. NPDC093260]|uniref:DUF3558 domain-containing protein n=1 Tax=Streptomyces sp. NPDC093260 TaxID=3155073 RepID=UPI003425FD8B